MLVGKDESNNNLKLLAETGLGNSSTFVRCSIYVTRQCLPVQTPLSMSDANIKYFKITGDNRIRNIVTGCPLKTSLFKSTGLQ